MLWLHSLPHAQSQHHSETHNTVASVKKEEDREKPAQVRPKNTPKKPQTIMDKIAWKSLLGVIVGEGRRRLA